MPILIVTQSPTIIWRQATMTCSKDAGYINHLNNLIQPHIYPGLILRWTLPCRALVKQLHVKACHMIFKWFPRRWTMYQDDQRAKILPRTRAFSPCKHITATSHTFCSTLSPSCYQAFLTNMCKPMLAFWQGILAARNTTSNNLIPPILRIYYSTSFAVHENTCWHW